MVNAAPVESPVTAAPVETPPDVQLTAAPEAPVEIAPATETASAPAETEIVDPLAEYDSDTLKASPSVKALLEAEAKSVEARKEESYRQRVQAAEQEAERKANADAYARQQAELEAIDNGSAVDALRNALRSSVDLSVDPDAMARLDAQLPVLGEMAKTLQRTTQTRIDRGYVENTNEYLTDNFPDYRVAPDVVAKFDAALAKGDFKARHAILLDIVKDAAVSAATPAVRQAAVRELKAEAENALKLQKQQADERTAAGNGGPTPVNGRPANLGTYRNLQEVAAAHVAGQLSNEQVRAYRAMPRDQMPEF